MSLIEDLFFENDDTTGWGGEIYMKSLKGMIDFMQLTEDLPCGRALIKAGYHWDGATVGPTRHLPVIGFPKWKHPIASCRHDKRCQIAAKYKKTDKAKYKRLRKRADQMFKADVSRGGTWWEKKKGYIGVRIGAFF